MYRPTISPGRYSRPSSPRTGSQTYTSSGFCSLRTSITLLIVSNRPTEPMYPAAGLRSSIEPKHYSPQRRGHPTTFERQEMLLTLADLKLAPVMPPLMRRCFQPSEEWTFKYSLHFRPEFARSRCCERLHNNGGSPKIRSHTVSDTLPRICDKVCTPTPVELKYMTRPLGSSFALYCLIVTQ